MFREAYIRDNNQIKPEDDFLVKLKEMVSQEEETMVYLEGYTVLPDAEDTKVVRDKKTWKLLAVAAGFALVCTVAFFVNGRGLLGDGENLKTDIESIIHQEEPNSLLKEKDGATISVECRAEYEKAYALFQNSNVVIYRTKDFMNVEENPEAVHRRIQECVSLTHDERDELVGDILAEQYELIESKENFAASEYYIAEFEDGSLVCFIIESGKYIYIEEVSGIQNMADISFLETMC